MKTLLKIIAAAAALAMTPAAGWAQNPAPGAAPAPSAEAPASQALPAQPQELSAPPLAQSGEEPSDATVANTVDVPRGSPTPGVGQPDGRASMQEQVTPIGRYTAWFHNQILLPIIAAISLFVLGLLLWVIIRYRRSANPVPSRTSHNTALEIVWTLVPVLVLVAIALPSIQLLADKYSPPRADITVKAIGNQWYWNYQYPDHGDFELTSNVLSDEEANRRGEPRLFGVDERMVVPAGAVVKVIVTSNDVIHAWGVPAFSTKIDAVPGRLNETWFKVDRPGVYYGQCYELCGARHAYMPIAVEVVPPAQFAAWVASKGGTMPGGAQARSGDESATSPMSAGGAPPPDLEVTAGGGATETSPDPQHVVNAVQAPPVSSQGATNSKRGGSQ